MRSFNETTRHIARSKSVYLVDAERLMPKTREYMMDDVHYTERGARVLAELIAAHIDSARRADSRQKDHGHKGEADSEQLAEGE